MTDYLTTDTELTSVANAIRTKGGTSAQLTYPAGFVSAIEAIPTGGGGASGPYVVGNGLNTTSATISPAIADDGDTVTIRWTRQYVIEPGMGLGVYDVNRQTLMTLYTMPMISSGSTFTFTMPAQSVVVGWV